MKILYLAHNFYDRKLMRKWELKLEGKYNISLDNPFYDNDRNDIKALDKLKDHSKEQNEYFKLRNTIDMVDKIVDGDLVMIRKADGLVTVIKSASIGTSMEIFYASRILRVPVYVITKNYNFHPWIKKHATKIFRTRREFEKFVKEEYGERR